MTLTSQKTPNTTAVEVGDIKFYITGGLMSLLVTEVQKRSYSTAGRWVLPIRRCSVAASPNPWQGFIRCFSSHWKAHIFLCFNLKSNTRREEEGEKFHSFFRIKAGSFILKYARIWTDLHRRLHDRLFSLLFNPFLHRLVVLKCPDHWACDQQLKTDRSSTMIKTTFSCIDRFGAFCVAEVVTYRVYRMYMDRKEGRRWSNILIMQLQ